MNQVYPAIFPCEGAVVEGKLMCLSEEELSQFDAYEGEEYRRTKVRVYVSSESDDQQKDENGEEEKEEENGKEGDQEEKEVYVYVYEERLRDQLEGTWSFDTYQHNHQQTWVNATIGERLEETSSAIVD